MKAVKIVLFILIQILLLPMLIVGFVWVGYKQLFVSRKLGVSATAIDILSSRWVQHALRGREDFKLFSLLKTSDIGRLSQHQQQVLSM